LCQQTARSGGTNALKMLKQGMPEHSQRRVGIALVTAAAVAWSTAPFFTRLLPFDSWTILFWRGLFGGSFIVALLLTTQGRTVFRDIARMGVSGWLVAALSTLGMVAFIRRYNSPAWQTSQSTGSGSRVGTGCNFRQRLTHIRHRRVLIIGGALIFANRKRIAEFALQHRLASAL